MAAILKDPSLELKLLLGECSVALHLGTGVNGSKEAETAGGGGGEGVLENARDSHKEKDPHKETHREKETHKDKDKDKDKERDRDSLRELEEGSNFPLF